MMTLMCSSDGECVWTCYEDSPSRFLRDIFASQFSSLCSDDMFWRDRFPEILIGCRVKSQMMLDKSFKVFSTLKFEQEHVVLNYSCVMRYDVPRASDWPSFAVISHVIISQNAFELDDR